MTTPTISEKIKEVAYYISEEVSDTETQVKLIKQLLSDFAEHITPEKVQAKNLPKYLLPRPGTDDTWIDALRYEEGHNACVDTITKRTKEYLK
jgi:hypothetical protein